MEFADFIKTDGEIRQTKKEGYDFFKGVEGEPIREVIDFAKPPMASVFPPEDLHKEHIPDRPSLPSLAELEEEERLLAADKAQFAKDQAEFEKEKEVLEDGDPEPPDPEPKKKGKNKKGA